VQAPSPAGDGAHTTSTPSRQGSRQGDHEVANPSRGQSNDGPSGGRVTHGEAEE
jgi:hypothetical protein